MRIRHYGFLANRRRKRMLEQARALLGQPSAEAGPASLEGSGEAVHLEKVVDPFLCPRCKQGRLVIVGDIQSVVNACPGLESVNTS